LSDRIRNQLIQRGFLEYGDAQNLQKCIEWDLQRQALLDDRGDDIDRDRNPDLRLHGVLGGPVKRLDSKVLLDPTEEQLDLPTELVDLSDSQSGKREVIRQEDQIATVVSIVKANATKAFGVASVGIEPVEDDGLIAAKIRRSIHGMRGEAMATQVRLRSDDEEGLALMQSKEAAVMNVAAVEDIEAAGLGDELVQDPHVMSFSIGNMDKRRDRTSKNREAYGA
jgi:hypothetical protein